MLDFEYTYCLVKVITKRDDVYRDCKLRVCGTSGLQKLRISECRRHNILLQSVILSVADTNLCSSL